MVPGVPPKITAPKPRYKPEIPSLLIVLVRASMGPLYVLEACSRALMVSSGCVQARATIEAEAEPRTLASMSVEASGASSFSSSRVESLMLQ